MRRKKMPVKINRRDALKYFVGGGVGGAVLGWFGKAEFGTKPCPPTEDGFVNESTCCVTDLEHCYKLWPNGNYVLIDEPMLGTHFYPIESQEFELHAIRNPVRLSEGTWTQAQIEVRLKEGADVYRAYADLHHCTRAYAKTRLYSKAYGHHVTGRYRPAPNSIRDIQKQFDITGAQTGRISMSVPRDMGKTGALKHSWGDYSQLDARILEAVNSYKGDVQEDIRVALKREA